MWFQLGIILLVCAFFMYLGVSFGTTVAALIINATIIFLIIYRSYFEIQAGRIKYYIVGAIGAFVLLLFIGNFGAPFWTITTFLVMAYVIALFAHILLLSMPRNKLIHGKLTKK